MGLLGPNLWRCWIGPTTSPKLHPGLRQQPLTQTVGSSNLSGQSPDRRALFVAMGKLTRHGLTFGPDETGWTGGHETS